MKRNVLVAILSTFVTTSLFAINPYARYETRMVYVPQRGSMVLFGGITSVDSGTKQAYHLNDTWEWTGSRWIQRFPAHVPTERSGHVMVWDSNRSRIVMFGGRSNTADLNDTWVYQNNDWTEIATPNSPPPRQLMGGAYDPIRDRFVIFGGTQTSPPPAGTINPVLTAIYDTWEFDGTTWTQVGGTGPTVTKPILTYDAARNQIIMLALDANAATVMYSYDADAGTWSQVKPATLPACANEGQMAYNPDTQTVVYTGGVCSNSTGVDLTYEWDGTTWNNITLVTPDTEVFGAAMDYDQSRQLMTLFGGSPVVGLPVSDTWVYSSQSKAWFSLSDGTRPAARSLYAFVTDPVNNTIWFYGGSDDSIVYSDFWQYNDGTWTQIFNDSTPASCLTPAAAWDSDRNKLVMVCANSDLYEWDGTTWTGHIGLKNTPPTHQWGSVVYDPTLKKTVLYGGFDGVNYSDETWTWDGTSWSRQKNHPAPARALAQMWYDPTLKKTVIYGGIGRITTTDRVTRYSDMWTFDGSGWTELNPTGGTPGPRYGAQVLVDPHTNHLLLFGGMFDTVTPPVPPATQPTEVQSYVSDMWDWDGSKWTQITPPATPGPRENARMTYDPSRDNIVMFGGYAGTFLSDTWVYDGSTWKAVVFDPLGNRRRVAGH